MRYNFFLNLVTWCLGAILKRTGGQIGTFLSLSSNVLGLSLVISRGSRVKMICEGFMRDTSELGGGVWVLNGMVQFALGLNYNL